MADTHLADITAAHFDQEVLVRSQTLPVLVDFWAPWCGPCRMLMPVLAALAQSYAGAFFLAKVNTDVEQALATRYGVRSLPTVKLFRNGAVVDEFLGVQPERSIRALLDRHVARASDMVAEQARAEARAGELTRAVALLQQALTDDPGNDRIKIDLAGLYLDDQRLDEGEQLLKQLSAESQTEPRVQALQGRLALLRWADGAPPLPTLKTHVANHPEDHGARLQYGAGLALATQHEEALDELLELVRRSRKSGDDQGRRAVLAVFHLLGGKGDLVKRYRGLLSATLH